MGLVIGTVGTAIAIGTAVDTIATVGLTLTAALEVTAAVGGVLSVVGMATGNKDLSMAGMALGIVGGVGSLAASAGVFGSDASTAPLFGSGADTATSAAATDAGNATADIGSQVENAATAATDPGTAIANAATAGTNPADVATSAAATDAGNGSGDIINSIGQTDTAATQPQAAIADQTAQAEGNAAQTITGGDNSTPLSTALNQPNANTLPPQQAGVPQGAGTVPAPPGVPTPAAPTANVDPVTGLPETTADIPGEKPPIPGGAFDASIAAQNNGSVLSSLTSFAKNNPMATYGLIQAAGSFAQGAFSPVTPAQVNALNAQAAANNAAAGLTKQQIANLQQPKAVATLGPAVQSPAQIAAAQPVQSPPVTGQPVGLINRQAA